MPFQKGNPGRPKGAKNKVTSAARQAFLATFTDLEPDLKGWIKATAEGWDQEVVLKNGDRVTVRVGKDPARAADLIIRMGEFHFPKLARSEVSGPDGDPLTVNVVTYAPKGEE